MYGLGRWVVCGVIFLAAMALTSRADATNGVVGPGNCNAGGFESVLSAVDGSGGGTITFNCGTDVFTLDSYRQIAHAVTIDGGGTITFDGVNMGGFFQIFASANVTLKGLSLVRGKYIGGVRAIENFGVLTLDHIRLVNNNASDRGPVVNYGTLIVRASTFTNNAGTAIDADGGAIENNGGQLRVTSSTFNGNNAGRHGGAIYSNFNFSVANSTFNANTANSGGAIYQDGTGESSIVYATIVANTGSSFSGGVYNDGAATSTLTISRSIISGNGNGNCDGVLISGGYNLWAGTTMCPFSATGDLGATTPTLTPGALANNGGPTLTMLPAGGNVAINHIPSAQCQIPVDQRGAVRPSGAGCDTGAVEVGGSLTDLIFYDSFE